MSRLSDCFMQNVSCHASKIAADAIRTQEDGVSAYSMGGKILLGCGVGWFLLSFIPIVCKNPINDWVWMWILAAIHIVIGIVLVIMSRKSKKFQQWAAKDFRKSLKENEKLVEKVRIKKVTLPMTYGDVLALKVLGILAIILIAIFEMGSLQGWIK